MNVPWPGRPTARPFVSSSRYAFEHGVRVDRQLRNDVPDLRELIARREVAEAERVLDLLDELQVRRHTRAEIEAELHRRDPPWTSGLAIPLS